MIPVLILLLQVPWLTVLKGACRLSAQELLSAEESLGTMWFWGSNLGLLGLGR